MWVIGPALSAVLLVPTAPTPVPLVPEPGPAQQGCVVPVGTLPAPCPGPDRRPPVSCVLPVTGTPLTPLGADCPERVPAPRGRTLPLTR